MQQRKLLLAKASAGDARTQTRRDANQRDHDGIGSGELWGWSSRANAWTSRRGQLRGFALINERNHRDHIRERIEGCRREQICCEQCALRAVVGARRMLLIVLLTVAAVRGNRACFSMRSTRRRTAVLKHDVCKLGNPAAREQHRNERQERRESAARVASETPDGRNIVPLRLTRVRIELCRFEIMELRTFV